MKKQCTKYFNNQKLTEKTTNETRLNESLLYNIYKVNKGLCKYPNNVKEARKPFCSKL